MEHNQPIVADKLLDRSPDRIAVDAVLVGQLKARLGGRRADAGHAKGHPRPSDTRVAPIDVGWPGLGQALTTA